MGLLKKLKKAINPIHGVKTGINSVKSLAHGDIMATLDPDHWILPEKPKVPGGPAVDPNNPFAALMARAGTQPNGGGGGANSFANVMSQIPPSFFNSPQAQQALAQILGPQGSPPAPGGQPSPYIPTPGGGVQGIIAQQSQKTPGPAPDPSTLLARASGFGNGGGALGLQASRFMFKAR